MRESLKYLRKPVVYIFKVLLLDCHSDELDCKPLTALLSVLETILC